jgi:quinol monooxygenase YgiN
VSMPIPASAPISQQVPGGVGGTRSDSEFSADVKATGSSAVAKTRPYGRILIFTLLDDKAVDFDRLAEQTAEEVRVGEPDTLVYVIHLVPNAPMQRIFYEIYRDRAAFDSHENKSYMKRFVAERRAWVLATNVIELRLKYAKVAPLPTEPRSLTAGSAARAQLPPGPATQRAGDGTPARSGETSRTGDGIGARTGDGTAPGSRTGGGAGRRPAGTSGQWPQPSADPRYGRV